MEPLTVREGSDKVLQIGSTHPEGIDNLKMAHSRIERADLASAPTQLTLFNRDLGRTEQFEHDQVRNRLVRLVNVGRAAKKSFVPIADKSLNSSDLGASFDASWLRAHALDWDSGRRRKIRIVDVFSGCGGLSLGVSEAVRAVECNAEHVLAMDLDPGAIQVYLANSPGVRVLQGDVCKFFPGEFGDALSGMEKAFRRESGEIDFLVGGPPCQGHSDLNNHTRRTDPRNSLYSKMARCAEVLRPRHVIIENVPGVVHDKHDVVERTSKALSSLGYSIDAHVVRVAEIGVPQNRKRHILVATKGKPIKLESLVASYATDSRTFAWACGDLAELVSEKVFDSAAVHSADNQARIDFLFDHDLYDLPNEQRPDCHRLKDHSYNSVYGRLRWDQPVPTITRGFGSTGQGRFVHPLKRRSLTPHEAARLQFFPDWFDLGSIRRYALQIMIGNAVPSKLSFVVSLELLRQE